MNIEEEFKKWYATEGIRNLLPKGEHWHEYYSKLAFIAGISAYSDYLLTKVDEITKETKN